MFLKDTSFIVPDWPSPKFVKAYVSTRLSGVSEFPFGSLNLGAHVGDDLSAVKENRQIFSNQLGMPDSVRWLNQVHGVEVASLPCDYLPESADAAYTNELGQVCAVLTADCLPVFFCDEKGSQVAVAHAGWRGLCSGVLESTLERFDDSKSVMAWLGPAIGPKAFEVGDDVRDAFVTISEVAELAFKATAVEGKWLADLYLLARQRLATVGVTRVYGGDYCTYSDDETFYSYRRDKQTGRMASVIWLEAKS